MKYFCLWLFLFSVFSVHAETMEWRVVSEVLRTFVSDGLLFLR